MKRIILNGQIKKLKQKLEKNIAQLDKANTKSSQNSKQGEIDAQLNNQQEQLKTVVEKLAGFETMKTQIDDVAKTVTKLESKSNQSTQSISIINNFKSISVKARRFSGFGLQSV